MKSKRTVVLAGFAVVGVWLVATGVLWPYHQMLLHGVDEPVVNPQVELADISPTAPLSLITEPEDGMATVTQMIASAQKTVDLVVYELEDPQLEQTLVDVHSRGVAVRVSLDNLSSFGNHPNQAAFDFLKAHNVPVEWTPSYFPLTHQKIFIIDDTQAVIATFNFTPKYYASSRDFAVVDSSPADVAAIEAAFNSDWSGNQTTAGNASDLVWSPGSSATLLALIQSASSTLDVYNEEMADPRIIAALEVAAARGVSVRVDMTYDTTWKSAFNDLTQKGVRVRTYASSAKFYIHAKVIVADGKEAFVGSENFSAQSMDANRELGILITQPDTTDSLESTFNKDWLGSRPYTIKQ
jgi:phosphatidylserine/phosphatidylglycerophosphate/cardiolipin synthase-like enzyme